MWSIRIHHERQSYDQACMLTLTYDEDNCPDAISKETLQKFIKRLRKDSKTEGYKAPAFKYFACGEYGSQTRRPHYHAIILGSDFRGGQYSYRIDDSLYGNKFVESKWGLGAISICDYSMSTSCYVAGYVTKKVGDPDSFRLMSRGLGKDFALKYADELARLESVVIEGKEYPIPSQYFRWLEDELDGVKANKQSFCGEYSYNQLQSKRLNAQAKQRLKVGKI